MLVYSSTISARLRYTGDFIGKELLDKPFQFTDDKEEFIHSTLPRINYSATRIIDEEYWVQPHILLFEAGVQEQNIECFGEGDQKAFFKTEGDMPFDIFSAIFYLLSRYEEYLPHEGDNYGRYPHEQSLAFKEDFLDTPLVNVWLKYFREKLRLKFPSLILQEPSFTFLPTYDIDEAWSFKHKHWTRNAGAAVKQLLNGDWKGFAFRIKVLSSTMRDPFDSYLWMNTLHEQYRLTPRYFFLVAQRTGRYDRNILPHKSAMRELIQKHSNSYATGVHPSWQSGDDPQLIGKEIAVMEKIIEKKISASRQHFIRFTLPQTFRHLIEAGIKEDFSMGYGSVNGFRASVASPFYWYDLEKESSTGLLLYPFCFMEANSFFEQKLTPALALEEMRYYYSTVKAINGTFVSIWHNTFLGTSELFTGWRDAYEQFIKETAV